MTDAVAEIAFRDPVLAGFIQLAGPLPDRSPEVDSSFWVLARAIVFQQLAGRAAQAIFGRVITAAGGQLTPQSLAGASDADLRAAGLSANKLASLRDLTAKTLEGSIDLSAPSPLSDDEIVANLVTVRGIGRWTVEMYLMFHLRRPDVWPVDDLGVRQGYGLIWNLDPAPTPKQLAPLGDPFRPHRSLVARYCWQAVAMLRSGTDPRLR